MVSVPDEKKTDLISAEMTPQFFKIYLPDQSSQKMKIPPAFKHYFNGVIPNKAILRSRNGRVWHVELEQVDNSLYLQEGWKEYVKDQSLKLGEFLIFRYDGNSVFDVKIFGINGCVKEDPLVNHNYDRFTPHPKKEEDPKAEEVINNCTAVIENFPEFNGHRRKRRPKYGSPRFKVVEEMTLKAAGMGKIMNPYFVASFVPDRPYDLFIPKTLIVKHHLKIVPEMTVCDPNGKFWRVKTSRWKDGRVSLAKGWGALCKENKLGIDDRCIFEFIKGKDRNIDTVKVHIVWARERGGTSVSSTKAKKDASCKDW